MTAPLAPPAVEVLKVSARSHANSVAGAVAAVLRQNGSAAIQVVGAGALNQAVKGVAISRTYLDGCGVDVVCVPSFVEVHIDGEARTAIRLDVEDRAWRGGEPTVDLTDLDGSLLALGAATVGS